MPADHCRVGMKAGPEDADLLSFSEKPETQLVKQNLLISKCWKKVHLFKITERTRGTPLKPWAVRGYRCSLGEILAFLKQRGCFRFTSGSRGRGVHFTQHCPLYTALPAPASHHWCGLDSSDPWWTRGNCLGSLDRDAAEILPKPKGFPRVHPEVSTL